MLGGLRLSSPGRGGAGRIGENAVFAHRESDSIVSVVEQDRLARVFGSPWCRDWTSG